MISGFVDATLLVCILAGFTIIASLYLAYAAHCLLVVVTATAGGQDEINWAGESPLDWLREVPPFVSVVAVCLAPAAPLAGLLADRLLPDAPRLRFAVLAAASLWLLLPVGLLSSLSADSPWVFLRPAVVARLLRIPLALAHFYAASAVVALAMTTVWALAFSGASALLFPAAALVTASGLLIYGRLLGRLAGLVGGLPPLRGRKKRRAVGRKARRLTRPAVSNPWAVPVEPPEPFRDPHRRLPPDDTSGGEGYALADEEPVRPPRFKLIKDSPFLDVEVTPGRAKRDPEPPPTRPVDPEDVLQTIPEEEPGRARLPQPDITASRADERTARPEGPTALPARPLVSGVYTFPWYATTLRTWFLLSLGTLAFGVVLAELLGRISRVGPPDPGGL